MSGAIGFLYPVIGPRFLGFAGSLILVAVAALQPQAAIWGMLGAIYFGNRTEFPELVFLGRWLPTVGIALLAPALVVEWSRRANADPLRDRLLVVASAFIAVTALSAIVNQTTIVGWVTGAVVYLRYPLFFLLIRRLELSFAAYARLLWAIVALGLTQVPLTGIQYFLFGLWGDLLNGTLGNNGSLLMAMLGAICLLWARLLIGGSQRWLLAGIGLLVVPLVLADIQIWVLCVPASLGFMVLRSRAGVRALRLGASAAAAVAFVGLVLLVLAPEALARLETLAEAPDNLGTDTMRTASVGRLALLPFIASVLLEDGVRLAVGFGPESTYGGMLGGSVGAACEVFASRGLTSCRTTQVFRTAAEFGVLGLGISLAMLLVVWRSCEAALSSVDPERRVVALAFQGIALLYVVILPIYGDVWRLDVFPFFFWLCAAATLAARRPERTEGGA